MVWNVQGSPGWRYNAKHFGKYAGKYAGKFAGRAISALPYAGMAYSVGKFAYKTGRRYLNARNRAAKARARIIQQRRHPGRRMKTPVLRVNHTLRNAIYAKSAVAAQGWNRHSFTGYNETRSLLHCIQPIFDCTWDETGVFEENVEAKWLSDNYDPDSVDVHPRCRKWLSAAAGLGSVGTAIAGQQRWLPAIPITPICYDQNAVGAGDAIRCRLGGTIKTTNIWFSFDTYRYRDTNADAIDNNSSLRWVIIKTFDKADPADAHLYPKTYLQTYTETGPDVDHLAPLTKWNAPFTKRENESTYPGLKTNDWHRKQKIIAAGYLKPFKKGASKGKVKVQRKIKTKFHYLEVDDQSPVETLHLLIWSNAAPWEGSADSATETYRGFRTPPDVFVFDIKWGYSFMK